MLTKCVLGMTLKCNHPTALWVSPGRQRLGEHALRKKQPKRPQRWNRRRMMAEFRGTSQQLGRRMKAAAEMGPQSSWFPCHWILTQICQGPCGGCAVHQSPHVKQSYAQALPPCCWDNAARRDRRRLHHHHHQPPPCFPTHTAPKYAGHGSAFTAIWGLTNSQPQGGQSYSPPYPVTSKALLSSVGLFLLNWKKKGKGKGIRCVPISWALVNKPELSDASLCHNLVCSRGDVYMPAVSNTQTWVSSQTHCFFAHEGHGGVRFTSSSWPVHCYAGMSDVGDVYIHPKTTALHRKKHL